MEESPMVFEHALVNRSWLSYEIGKDRSMAAILHVEPNRPIQGGRGDIDRAEVLPRNVD